MSFPTWLPGLAGDHALAGAARAVLAAAAFALWLTVRRATRRITQGLRGHRAEDVLTLIAASVATTVAMTGMWRFFGVVLHFSGALRILLFAFIELAVVTSAVRARRNMREIYAAGIDGAAVWVLTGLSAVLSSLDARSPAEALFRLAAPLVAAWLWERGLAVERRRVTGQRGIHWRLTPERVFVLLGLAESASRTTGEVDAHRRLTRLARSAKRARVLRGTGAAAWRQRRAGGGSTWRWSGPSSMRAWPTTRCGRASCSHGWARCTARRGWPSLTRPPRGTAPPRRGPHPEVQTYPYLAPYLEVYLRTSPRRSRSRPRTRRRHPRNRPPRSCTRRTGTHPRPVYLPCLRSAMWALTCSHRSPMT